MRQDDPIRRACFRPARSAQNSRAKSSVDPPAPSWGGFALASVLLAAPVARTKLVVRANIDPGFRPEGPLMEVSSPTTFSVPWQRASLYTTACSTGSAVPVWSAASSTNCSVLTRGTRLTVEQPTERFPRPAAHGDGPRISSEPS